MNNLDFYFLGIGSGVVLVLLACYVSIVMWE
jgi:hypothetical protein